MPPAKQPRCMYVEKNRRCSKHGYPFCTTHMIVMQDASRPPVLDNPMDDIVKMFTGRRKVDLRTLLGGAAMGAFAAFAANASAKEAGLPSSPEIDAFWAKMFPGQRSPTTGGFPGGPRSAPRSPPVDPEVTRRRKASGDARVQLGFSPSDVLTAEMVKKRRRELAKRYHPDKATGGSPETMARINAAASLLLEEIG